MIDKKGSTDNAPEGHDPLVCGILGPCEWCRTHRPPDPLSPYDQAARDWEQMQSRHWRLLRDGVRQPWERPDPMSANELGRLAVTILSPKHRPLLRELLLGLLAEPIADIAMAAVKEARP